MNLLAYNIKQISYLLYVFATERRLNHYVPIREDKFIQLCRIYRHHGECHRELIKKIIQGDKKGVGE